jgi:hypothetical protein
LGDLVAGGRSYSAPRRASTLFHVSPRCARDWAPPPSSGRRPFIRGRWAHDTARRVTRRAAPLLRGYRDPRTPAARRFLDPDSRNPPCARGADERDRPTGGSVGVADPGGAGCRHSTPRSWWLVGRCAPLRMETARDSLSKARCPAILVRASQPLRRVPPHTCRSSCRADFV